MSTLRKMKHQKRKFDKPEKTQTKLTPRDTLLIIGATLMIVGIISGFFSYNRYVSGSSARISNSQFGTKYIPEKPAGRPADKEIAVFSFIMAGIGTLISAIAIISNLVIKHLALSKKNLDPLSTVQPNAP